MSKLGILGLCVAFLIFTGCGRKTEEQVFEKTIKKAIEKESGGSAKVDIQDETMKITTKDGEVTISGGGNAKLPDDFPSDILIYDGAKIMACMQAPGGMSVSFTCKDAPAKVASVYRLKMKEKGWGLEQAMDMGQQQIVMFIKDERNLVVSIGENDEGTFVGLTLGKRE